METKAPLKLSQCSADPPGGGKYKGHYKLGPYQVLNQRMNIQSILDF